MASFRSSKIFSFKILNVSLPVKNVRVQQIVKIYKAEANIEFFFNYIGEGEANIVLKWNYSSDYRYF